MSNIGDTYVDSDRKKTYECEAKVTTTPTIENKTGITHDIWTDVTHKSCSTFTLKDFLEVYQKNRDNHNLNPFAYWTGMTNLSDEIPLSFDDTSNITDTRGMFYGCSSLTTVPLFDTSNVTNMDSMFYGCTSLPTVPEFDTSNVTSMQGMFFQCPELITVPSLDMQNVTNALYMFNGCKNLTNCKLRNIKVNNLSVGSGSDRGHLLTMESLLFMIGELINIGESRTFTVGTANLEKLANVYVKLVTVTNKMKAADPLIDKKSPFEVCESTEVGAMTIEQYVGLKSWTIA